jgi:hypothetical protein
MIAGAGPDAGKRLPFDSLDGSAGEPLVVALLSGSPEDRIEERSARWNLAGALVAHLNEAPAGPSPDWSRHLSDEHKTLLCAIRTVYCHKRRWKQQLACLNSLRSVAQQPQSVALIALQSVAQQPQSVALNALQSVARQPQSVALIALHTPR